MPGISTVQDTSKTVKQNSGHWRNEIGEVDGLRVLDKNARGSNNYSKEAKQVSYNFRKYFNSPQGAVSWQTEKPQATINSFDIMQDGEL